MKYFHEMNGHAHYDLEYGKIVDENTLREELKYLLEKLVFICNEHNVKIIIMHGTLIGYHFNKKILPYDDDIDVVILEEDIKSFLKLEGMETENYIIKINPNFINRSPTDRDNVIDARIISKKYGCFIDITFLTTDVKNYYHCKSPHYYRKDFMVPLKKDTFENVDIYVPNKYLFCLFQEYGKKVILPTYKKWVFKNNEWKKN